MGRVLAQLSDGRPPVGLPGNPLAAVAALLALLGPLVDGVSGLVPAVPERAGLLGWGSTGVDRRAPWSPSRAAKTARSRRPGRRARRSCAGRDLGRRAPEAGQGTTTTDIRPAP